MRKKQRQRQKIMVLKMDKNKKNTFVLKLLPQNIDFTRKLNDLYWLRSKLCVEFPYNYVPPVKCVDYKENFVQNFFDRLMNMDYISESKTMKLFINEAEFMGKKKKEVSNLNYESEK